MYTNSVVWEYVDLEGDTLYSAQRLPNGNTLIAKKKKVFEINPSGQIVWERNGKGLGYIGVDFYDAQRLPNGDTLVAGSGSTASSGAYNPLGVILQLNHAGEVVWSYESKPQVAFTFAFQEADRLPNGNTLMSSGNGYGGAFVLEVTQSGNVVFLHYPVDDKYGYADIVHDADRLPNGNTLISAQDCPLNEPCASYVREVSPAGATVWEHPISDAYPDVTSEDAERMPNQMTFIAEFDPNVHQYGSRIIMIDLGGNIQWEYHLAFPRSIDAIPPMHLTAKGGTKRIALDWDDYAISGQYVYRIYRATTSGGPYTEIGSTLESHFNDGTVTVGIPYYYVVTIAEPGLESPYSNEASATAGLGWKPAPGAD